MDSAKPRKALATALRTASPIRVQERWRECWDCGTEIFRACSTMG